jgi:hypothetical protein
MNWLEEVDKANGEKELLALRKRLAAAKPDEPNRREAAEMVTMMITRRGLREDAEEE